MVWSMVSWLFCFHCFRVHSIDLIPEKEYVCLLLKITLTRILMLSEYTKENFSIVSGQKVTDISS